uniref:Uncharacterized protein n=1 Tax=Calidris pygmaea TaxID=425635 RepID=A0A8C3KUG8_9CHAR
SPQCTNGHLMCAGCFIHLLADARLKEEQATCPNCRCEISKSLCCRNLAVEKAVSELPSECGFCMQQFPRSLLERHQKEECQDSRRCSASPCVTTWVGGLQNATRVVSHHPCRVPPAISRHWLCPSNTGLVPPVVSHHPSLDTSPVPPLVLSHHPYSIPLVVSRHLCPATCVPPPVSRHWSCPTTHIPSHQSCPTTHIPSHHQLCPTTHIPSHWSCPTTHIPSHQSCPITHVPSHDPCSSTGCVPPPVLHSAACIWTLIMSHHPCSVP